jgi:probable DNA metabolism protein
MTTLVYDGSFEGFLCAVFDVYEYKFTDVEIAPEARCNLNIFGRLHQVNHDKAHSDRVWKGLEKKLSLEAQNALHRAFLSELPGIEDTLLRYIQYVFAAKDGMETDFSHDAVLTITQTAKKVWREKHRMEAFVRFQKTRDGLYFAVIEPDYNVLPLIAKHFENRYANQQWLIYDATRRYGMHYNGTYTVEVDISFDEAAASGKDVRYAYDAGEAIYQELWQQYFRSVNIPARKNTKLHVQHMPKRYWKYLPEKNPMTGSNRNNGAQKRPLGNAA